MVGADPGAPPVAKGSIACGQSRIVRQDIQFEGAVRVTFTRITVDPDKMGGVPCIRGLRIPIATIVEMVAEGMDDKKIL
jgi:hypothetical protein